jgi:Rap1a immunity proteins
VKTFLAVLAVLIGLLVIPSAKAQDKTSDMVEPCQTAAKIVTTMEAKGDLSQFTPSDWTDNGWCTGYVKGFINGAENLAYVTDNGIIRKIVVADNVTVGQCVTVFLAYTKAHPEMLDRPLNLTLVNAFATVGIFTGEDVGTLAAPPSKKPEPPPASDNSQTAKA